uniref:Uncharacterized protein n=1 Tax=Aegilops tauschii TaxID=37682 RepID=N1QUX3_AEGTA
MEMEYVSGVEEVEAHCANREPDKISFRLRASLPLKSSGELMIQVRAGHSGFRLYNQQLLYCKFKAKNAIERGFEQLIKASVWDPMAKVDDASICIGELNRLQRTADADMPPRGRNPFNLGKGARHVGPPPFVDDDIEKPQVANTDVSRQRPTARDIASQRAMWNLNLKAQELSKRLLTEHLYIMHRNLRDLKKEAMESPTDVGSGYVDFRFLHRSDQPNYLD